MSLPFDKLTKLSLQKHLGEIGQTEAEVRSSPLNPVTTSRPRTGAGRASR